MKNKKKQGKEIKRRNGNRKRKKERKKERKMERKKIPRILI